MNQRQLWYVANKLIIEQTSMTPNEKTSIRLELPNDEDWRAVDKALTWDSSTVGYNECYKTQVLWLLLFFKYLGGYQSSKGSMADYAERLYYGYTINPAAHTPTTDKILRFIIQSSGHRLE